MEIKASKRLEHFRTGIFADLNEKRLDLEKRGKKIYNFSIGTPDFLPEEHFTRAISEACSDPKN